MAWLSLGAALWLLCWSVEILFTEVSLEPSLMTGISYLHHWQPAYACLHLELLLLPICHLDALPPLSQLSLKTDFGRLWQTCFFAAPYTSRPRQAGCSSCKAVVGYTAAQRPWLLMPCLPQIPTQHCQPLTELLCPSGTGKSQETDAKGE